MRARTEHLDRGKLKLSCQCEGGGGREGGNQGAQWSSAKRVQPSPLGLVSSKNTNLKTKLTLQTETTDVCNILSRMPDASIQGPRENEKKPTGVRD